MSNQWEAEVREDHQALEAQAGALEAALSIDISPQDRRVVLSWIVRGLWPSLELHLRKEEEALFPALQKLLGEDASSITLLKEQHRELRSSLRRVAELLQETESTNWEGLTLASQSFIDLLEDHEKKEDRLLLDVLEFSLKPKELKALAGTLHDVALKAVTEEGWSAEGWKRSRGGVR